MSGNKIISVPPQGGDGYPPGGYPSAPPQDGYPPAQGGTGPPPYGLPAYAQQSYAGGSYGLSPVVNQPMGQGGPVNCPPGLEYLTMIDQLLVHQKVEVLTGYNTKNKYTIKNSLGEKVYYAVEQNVSPNLKCYEPRRPFDMDILDNYSNQVIGINRLPVSGSCCLACYLLIMEVSAPLGTVIGTIQQETVFFPTLALKNACGETVLRIQRVLSCNIRSDVEFKIMTSDGNTQIGKILKKWGGLLREMFTDADSYDITFPMDLDVRMKAVIMGACFIIDAMFFEEND